ncbi:MAG: hypothetical protein EOO09_20815 [Chitinophagaceae bacterium]|nr:MAG: hypothetical protein EOO09_20815 [Chitinophagaceae bacterium]
MFISLLASLRVFGRAGDPYRHLRTFPFFLLLSLVIESIGVYTSITNRNNLALYVPFSVFGICYFTWIISRMIGKPSVRKLVRGAIAVYALISAMNIYYFQKGLFPTVTYSLGCLMVVMVSIYFFLEIFRSAASVKLVSNPDFWITSALLFWHSCGLPLFGLINYWKGISPVVLVNFASILTILNIFLYLLFTIAFLCMKPRKYISSQS